MKRVILNSIFTSPEKFEGKEITVAGWARNIRTSNAFGFIMLNDGSYFTNLQVVIESSKIDNYKEIASQNIGASLIVKGTIVLTPDAPQPFELHASAVEIDSEQASHARISAFDCASASESKHILRRFPRAFGRRICNSQVLPGRKRLCLCTNASYHRL